MTLLLMLLACDPEYSPGGILVGNPGEVTLDTAPSDGLRWRSGRLPLDAVVLADCYGGAPVAAASGYSLDLLGGESLPLPAGDWCELTVLPSGPVIWEADVDDGWSLRLEVELERLSATSRWPFATDSASLLLIVGMADALDLDALAPEVGESEVVVDGAHPSYGDVLFALTDEVTLYDVTDVEGEPSEEDVVASDDCGICGDTGDTGECEPCGEPPSTDVGCGCGRNNYSLEQALLAPVLFLFVGWRRRRDRLL